MRDKVIVPTAVLPKYHGVDNPLGEFVDAPFQEAYKEKWRREGVLVRILVYDHPLTGKIWSLFATDMRQTTDNGKFVEFGQMSERGIDDVKDEFEAFMKQIRS